MLGQNQSGRPDSKDYLLGRACVFVSELDGVTGLPSGYRPVGNTPALTVSVDIEELTHRASLCSQFGGAVIDRRLIIQQALNLSMTLEELNHENVAVFFSGTLDAPANPAVAGITTYTLTTAAAMNAWYPIFDSAGVRALGIDAAMVTATETSGPTVLTGGDDDYELDETMGLIKFNAGGTGGLAGGETITIALAADVSAPATIERVKTLKAAQLRFAVKAIIENANNLNEQVEMEFHSVALIGDGDLSPVGDELAQMTLTGVAESNSNLAGAPTLTISKAQA